MALSEAEQARYARQLVIPGFSPITQEALAAARVHVVGAGEVAGPALIYLAQAGVGTLLLDDGLDVASEDGAAWLYAQDQVGQPRTFAAAAALKSVSEYARARPFATGAQPTAALICGGSPGTAREAAERARLAGIAHVVAATSRDGGEVISIPPGAPCYACASRPGMGVLDRAIFGAAVGALAALELILLITGSSSGPIGRRIELVLGNIQMRPTSRLPGCACARGRNA
ncbi:MAG TPA: ThiF family adenylyltransferase [Anaeromyxobacteraceae bacterium]|nr:ThiF family adenylyltransferase [Anaeromyxobacteraceae bacterium]